MNISKFYLPGVLQMVRMAELGLAIAPKLALKALINVGVGLATDY